MAWDAIATAMAASGTGPAAQNRQHLVQTPNQPPPAAATLDGSGSCARFASAEAMCIKGADFREADIALPVL